MICLSRLLRLPAAQTICLLIGLVSLSAITSGQTRAKAAAGEEEPIFNDYRGVQIGWLAEDVRKKLGSPADKVKSRIFMSLTKRRLLKFFTIKRPTKSSLFPSILRMVLQV